MSVRVFSLTIMITAATGACSSGFSCPPPWGEYVPAAIPKLLVLKVPSSSDWSLLCFFSSLRLGLRLLVPLSGRQRFQVSLLSGFTV